MNDKKRIERRIKQLQKEIETLPECHCSDEGDVDSDYYQDRIEREMEIERIHCEITELEFELRENNFSNLLQY